MPFRVRSSKRDSRGDADRLASVERSILQAIANAERELAGLRKRIEAVRQLAALSLGNGGGDYEERGAEEEQQLAKSESELVVGEARIRQLDTHVQHLRRVLGLLKTG
jgi:hypothetical protein